MFALLAISLAIYHHFVWLQQIRVNFFLYLRPLLNTARMLRNDQWLLSPPNSKSLPADILKWLLYFTSLSKVERWWQQHPDLVYCKNCQASEPSHYEIPQSHWDSIRNVGGFTFFLLMIVVFFSSELVLILFETGITTSAWMQCYSPKPQSGSLWFWVSKSLMLCWIFTIGLLQKDRTMQENTQHEEVPLDLSSDTSCFLCVYLDVCPWQ